MLLFSDTHPPTEQYWLPSGQRGVVVVVIAGVVTVAPRVVVTNGAVMLSPGVLGVVAAVVVVG